MDISTALHMSNRTTIAKLISDRLESQGIKNLQSEYILAGNINYFIVDNLLPTDLADEIDNSFPIESQLNFLNEGKNVNTLASTFLRIS